MTEYPSLIMCVGRKFYKLHEMVEEYQLMGISKRISITSLPEGVKPLESKIFVAHPDAIVQVGPEFLLFDLARMLYDEGLLTQEEVEEVGIYDWVMPDFEPTTEVPRPMLTLALALSKSPNKSMYDAAYHIKYIQGIVGFAYLERLEYVAREGETELPAQYAHLEDEVEVVKYTYPEDK